jgi:hypothetical protein
MIPSTGPRFCFPFHQPPIPACPLQVPAAAARGSHQRALTAASHRKHPGPHQHSSSSSSSSSSGSACCFEGSAAASQACHRQSDRSKGRPRKACTHGERELLELPRDRSSGRRPDYRGVAREQQYGRTRFSSRHVVYDGICKCSAAERSRSSWWG